MRPTLFCVTLLVVAACGTPTSPTGGVTCSDSCANLAAVCGTSASCQTACTAWSASMRECVAVAPSCAAVSACTPADMANPQSTSSVLTCTNGQASQNACPFGECDALGGTQCTAYTGYDAQTGSCKSGSNGSYCLSSGQKGASSTYQYVVVICINGGGTVQHCTGGCSNATSDGHYKCL